MRCRNAVCRTEKSRRFVLISGVYGEIGKAFKDVGKRQVRPTGGCAGKRIVGVTLRFF